MKSATTFTDRDAWIAQNVGELISMAPEPYLVPSNEKIIALLVEILNVSAEGNITAFSKAIDCYPKTVKGWLEGRSKIHLRDFLNLCWMGRISLRSLFQDLASDKTNRAYDDLSCPIRLLRIAVKNALDASKTRLGKSLMAATQKYPPPSPAEVLRSTRQKSWEALKTQFPEVSDKISFNHDRYVNDVLAPIRLEIPLPPRSEILKRSRYKSWKTLESSHPEFVQSITSNPLKSVRSEPSINITSPNHECMASAKPKSRSRSTSDKCIEPEDVQRRKLSADDQVTQNTIQPPMKLAYGEKKRMSLERELQQELQRDFPNRPKYIALKFNLAPSVVKRLFTDLHQAILAKRAAYQHEKRLQDPSNADIRLQQ